MMAGHSQLNLRKQLSKHLDDLPVLPAVVSKLMSLDSRAESYFDRVRELIEAEPNFATRILAAANSAASAPSDPITTIPAAIARIGSNNARNLVFALGVTRVFVPRDDWEKSLWTHALQAAVTARALALRTGDADPNPDEAYLCGLLHDVGRFVMFQEVPDQLRKIDQGGWDTPSELLAQERLVCGVTHAELGAIACERWSLPQSIVEVVRNHHRTEFTASRKVLRLTALVRLADVAMFPSAIPGHVGHAEEDEETAWRSLVASVPPFLNLSAHELHELLVDATREAQLIASALGLG